jgi:hypothetical protein
MKVYFEADTGHRILNIISYGPENELLLTYCFPNGSKFVSPFVSHGFELNLAPVPSVPSDKPKPNAKELNATMGKNVEGSLVVMRQMVKEGKL